MRIGERARRGAGAIALTLAAMAGAGPVREAAAQTPVLRTAPAVVGGVLRPSLREPPPLEDGALRRETGVFGSVPIPVAQIGLSPRFAAIRGSDPVAAVRTCLEEASPCPGEWSRRLRSVAATSRREDEAVLLRAVNRAVNAAVRYQADIAAWGVEDYWATPAETMARGVGDCEDYALLKMAILATLGIPEAQMSIVVVKDTARGIGHAVLAVRQGERFAILDNLSDAVRGDDEIASYVPLYSIGTSGTWIHGRRREPAPVRVSAASPAARAPVAAPLRGTLN